MKKNKNKFQLNTFGIGDGASTELVKDCAIAGHGHYSFIMNPEEIEKKVMEALQKDHLEYLQIKEASFLDLDCQVIKSLDTLELELTQGSRFLKTELLEAG